MRGQPGEQDTDRGQDTDRELVLRAPFAVMATLLFVTVLLVQVLLGLLPWSSYGDPLQWLLFATVFTVGYVALGRPWLRVSRTDVRVGNGPFTRRRVPLGDVSAARQLNPDRSGRRRRPEGRGLDLYPGWGPGVVVERTDGSRLVVGVPDAGRALSALGGVGVAVSQRSG